MRQQQRQQAAQRRHGHIGQHQRRPFERPEHGIENHEDHQDGDGQYDHEPLLRALLAGVFAGPIDLVSLRQLHVLLDLGDGLFHGAAQVAAAHAVLQRHVALVGFAIDLRSAIHGLDVAELAQGNALAGGRQQANAFDGFAGIAVPRQVARHQVEAPLALQHLGERVAAHGGLNGVLHVGHIDAVTRGRVAVHGEFRLGWPITRNMPRSSTPLMLRITLTISSPLASSGPQIVAVDLDGQLALHAADRFLHVVGDGLREVPEHARNFLHLAVHGGDQSRPCSGERRGAIVPWA